MLTAIQGNFEAALQDYTTAITLEPNFKNRAHTYHHHPFSFARSLPPPLALFSFGDLPSMIVGCCLTNAARYLNRGILSLLAGQKDRAQEDVAKALALDANVYILVSQYFTVRLDRNPHDILPTYLPTFCFYYS